MLEGGSGASQLSLFWINSKQFGLVKKIKLKIFLGKALGSPTLNMPNRQIQR